MPNQIQFRLIVKTLLRKGFSLVSQTGSHAKYRKIGHPTLNAIVPIHEKEVRYGTFKSIMRQSRIKEIEFRKKK